MDYSSFLKALLFLSFHMVQNKQRGAVRHTFFRLLPTKELCHPKSMSPTEKERTQSTPNKENKKFHNTLVLTQWIRMWSMVSSSSRQKKHLSAKNHPILFTRSNINTFSQEACQAKKRNPPLGEPMISKS